MLSKELLEKTVAEAIDIIPESIRKNRFGL